MDNVEVQSCVDVEDFHKLLVTKKLFEKISEQTNVYAVQEKSRTSSKRLAKWVSINKRKIQRLFGLVMWMGMVKLLYMNLYWSMDPLYYHPFPHKVMSRDCFEILLRMLHFTNNEVVDASNRLSKIQPVIDEFNQNFKKYYPLEVVYIDESLIPFHGRIIVR